MTMLQRLALCVALVSALFTVRGFAQFPPECVEGFQITENDQAIYIVPGVTNCFSCDDLGSSIGWQVQSQIGSLVVAQTFGMNGVSVSGNTLVISMVGDYVQPGPIGPRRIRCVGSGGERIGRLISPLLAAPILGDKTVDEGGTLFVSCDSGNILSITTFQILDPSGTPVPVDFVGLYEVENVTRALAGVYTCVVTSTLTNATINDTGTVTVRFASEVTPLNATDTPHRIILGEELRLRCDYVGVPDSSVTWYQNGTLLSNGTGGVTISGGAPGDNYSTLVVDPVRRDSRGSYTCRVNNTVGMDEASFMVIVLVPAEPVTNLMVTNIGEMNISLSWLTGFDGLTPITNIEILVTPERGNPANTVTLDPTNSTVVDELLPFREHEFSVAVINAAGVSERVNVSASTLSLRSPAPSNPRLVAESSTSLRLTWEAPSFDPDTTDAPDFYLIDFSLVDGSNPAPANISASQTLMVLFDGLLKGTMYSARITPVNVVGNGTRSVLLTTSTNVDPPSEPLDLTVSGVGATVLLVSWSASTDNGGRPLTNYRVAIDSIGFLNASIPPTQTTLLIRDNGLEENTTYTVNVGAANAEQGFGNNASATGTTQSLLEPQTIFDTPLSDFQLSTNSSAVLMWQNPGGTVDVYTVQYVLARVGFASGSVETILVNGSDNSVLVENLLPGASYDFRVAVNNSRGMSAFSALGRFETLPPDNPVITSSHENPVQEGTTVILNCTATIANPTYTWTKDDAALPAGNMFEVNPTYLRIVMATSDSSGRYMCRASNVNNDVLSEPYELEILPTPPPTESGISDTVIIIVATVGGVALLIFIIIVAAAVACLCKMKSQGSNNYAMKPMKSKDRPNANWIETSTQFVPATGNQEANPSAGGDRLAFDYSVDLQTHSSFNTLEKQKVHSTTNGSDLPPPPSYSIDHATVV